MDGNTEHVNKKDIGTQFTFEDKSEEEEVKNNKSKSYACYWFIEGIDITTKPSRFNYSDDEASNMFDEQVTGLLKTISEVEREDHKESDEANDHDKSFDSRKTSVYRGINEGGSPNKVDGSNSNNEFRIINES